MAINGFDQLAASVGGANRSGGVCANGIPRNLLTPFDEFGTDVVTPTTLPFAIVAVGTEAGAASILVNRVSPRRRKTSLNIINFDQEVIAQQATLQGMDLQGTGHIYVSVDARLRSPR